MLRSSSDGCRYYHQQIRAALVKVNLANVDSVRRWLNTEPPSVARLLAARTALRILPLLVEVANLSHNKTMYDRDAKNMAVATFAALIVAWGDDDTDMTLEAKSFDEAVAHF